MLFMDSLLADSGTQIVLGALRRAVADPGGMPLFGTKAVAGMFPATASARRAAQHCKDQGFLEVVGRQSRGKSVQEICALTEKGLAYLLTQVDPKSVLEDLVRVLDARKAEADEMLARARKTQADFEALRSTVEKLLRDLDQPALPATSTNGNGIQHCEPADPSRSVLDCLTRWDAAGTIEDCPLSELYRRVRDPLPTLSIGEFHDALRRLHEQQRIYLHPWTGPLYDLPEPAIALLVGHEVAFYASKR